VYKRQAMMIVIFEKAWEIFSGDVEWTSL